MIYAIGDIHGQQTMLRAMLDQLIRLPLREDDTLVFLGDYLDRGENSCAVIETLLDLWDRHPGIVFLRGNHEQLMLDAYDGPRPEPSPNPGFVLHSDQMALWLQNGGIDTVLSYGITDWMRWWEGIPDAHWEFIRATQMEYVTERYHFVHAGLLPPNTSWEGAGLGLDPRLWIREEFLSSRHDFDGRTVVFGHTPQRSGRPLIGRNKIGLDTGAVFGGPLTAAAFDPEADSPRSQAPCFFQIENACAEDEPADVLADV